MGLNDYHAGVFEVPHTSILQIIYVILVSLKVPIQYLDDRGPSYGVFCDFEKLPLCCKEPGKGSECFGLTRAPPVLRGAASALT